MRFDWSKLGRVGPKSLHNARLLAHHALQWPARAARANLRALPDDSHSSFGWNAEFSALLSRLLAAPAGDVRLGLRIAGLTLIVVRGDAVQDAFQLNRKSDAAAGDWLDSKLRALGLKPAGGVKLPYAMPDHSVAGDALYDLYMLDRELGELSRWFGGAAEALEDFTSRLDGLRPGPSPVCCWPHHFDIATAVGLEEGPADSVRSIGVGLSPGDEFYPQPYVYISPWPRFGGADLPELPLPGRWHTKGFFGAVATGEEILKLKDRGPELLEFITQAFKIGRARLGA